MLTICVVDYASGGFEQQNRQVDQRRKRHICPRGEFPVCK